MLSFISNSNQRLPHLRWTTIIFPAAFIVVFFVAAMELMLRERGFQPTILDSEARWQYERSRVAASGPRALALIGGSRIQLGVDLGELQRRTGLIPIQLAVDGGIFPPMLEGLANDTSFQGTVLIDYYDNNMATPLGVNLVEIYEKNYRESSHLNHLITYKEVEAELGENFYQNFSSYADGARPLDSLLARIVSNATPEYLTTRPDRSVLADYKLVAMPDFYLKRVSRSLAISKQHDSSLPEQQVLEERIKQLLPVNNAYFLQKLMIVERQVSTIQARGGRVIFVVMPSSGMVREIERRLYPRFLFWDELIQHTSAATIHFEDFQSLNDFNCPDGSHLDYRDRVRFTDALVGAMKL